MLTIDIVCPEMRELPLITHIVDKPEGHAITIEIDRAYLRRCGEMAEW